MSKKIYFRIQILFIISLSVITLASPSSLQRWQTSSSFSFVHPFSLRRSTSTSTRNTAFNPKVSSTSSSSLPMSKLIRLQNGPDQCLRNIASLADIKAKIESAREIQNKYRDAALYNQAWIPTTSHLNLSDSIHSERPDDSTTCDENPDRTFKVMQFNALAEGLSAGPRAPPPFDRVATNKGNKLKSVYGGFSDIPNPEISLNFSLRQWRLMEVLLGCSDDDDDKDFDIIALEEIDHFYGFFEPLLKMAGYQGLFVPKPYSPCVQSGWYSDGCAFFWKEGIFELIKEERGSYDIGNQVYIIATMRHIPTQKLFVFGSTHLKAGKGPAMESIRTLQVRQLLENANGVAQAAAAEASEAAAGDDSNNTLLGTIPIILMGDFNSDLREEKSCIHEIISSDDDGLCNMTSAYKVDPPGENFFTTWKTRGSKTVKRIIDYIFYSTSSTIHSRGMVGLECTHVLDVPNEVMEETLLPGFKYPSDHLAIGGIFKITDDPSK